MSHSNYTTKCDAKDNYEVEAHADALFPRKKRKYGSPVGRIASAASRERDAWCTSGADQCGPGGKTIEDKSPERGGASLGLRGGGRPQRRTLDTARCGEYAGLDIVWQGPGGRWFRRGAPLLAHLTRRDWNIKEYD
ncbi:hypothetical protein NDU88_002334 [Pleurodeles waltl]|uniref:Uncharacterized protein n=1 Tax=Pleurodeles waltl TaxID=8319 RepID=A0AAV7VAY7_PLEWA|nr:hypothetical protein NDU88_002334 [Pleurodeles waltl]